MKYLAENAKAWDKRYSINGRNVAPMLCSHCNEKAVFARKLCQACYYRLRRRGTVDRVNTQNQGKLCSVDDCGQPAHAKGLCSHHYSKAEHQLKDVWRRIRSRYPGEVAPSWNRFEGFVADVGDRPSPKHQLRRIDHAQFWAAGNLHWLAPVRPGQRNSQSAEDWSVYQRTHHLKHKFNLTPDAQNTMLAAQNGVCAICGQAETYRYPSGTLKSLAVDHNRETGAVRGLLCFNCNQGLGRFQHSIYRLQQAVTYLARHDAKQLTSGAA